MHIYSIVYIKNLSNNLIYKTSVTLLQLGTNVKVQIGANIRKKICPILGDSDRPDSRNFTLSCLLSPKTINKYVNPVFP